MEVHKKIIASWVAFWISAAANAAGLDGTWKTACYPEGAGYYAIVTLTFTANEVTSIGRAYRDEKCWDNAGSRTEKNAYVVGENFGDGTAIDFTDAKGRQSFAIFKLEDETLYWSDRVTRPAERPRSIDRDLPYLRQKVSARP